jgi:hypothetical protein
MCYLGILIRVHSRAFAVGLYLHKMTPPPGAEIFALPFCAFCALFAAIPSALAQMALTSSKP